MNHPLPDAALKGHIAVVGMTGGGKTFTTKGIVEHILERDPSARVCVLDPIKSDWWGVTSSADGKKPGLPFHILGGPRGHVPLHETAGKAIGELVGSGALPLSIIDMADFGPGGLQTFFNDFAPALLRRIRGVVYLVLEEAHEFAPKERAGFGGETMTVHFAKKLATAGRSKGVRIIAATQRTQQLHNSVLGSCQTVIAHQLTYPADIEPVAKWFKGHVDKETFSRFAETLTSMPTGTGWLCSGQAKVAEMVRFPRIWTFDNSATPDGEDEIDVKTAPVDLARLRAIVGDAVAEAEANDPAALRAEVARLRGELAKKPATAPDGVALTEAHERGYAAGQSHVFDVMAKREKAVRSNIENAIGALQRALDAIAIPELPRTAPAPTPGITHRPELFTPAAALKIGDKVTAPDGRRGTVTGSVSLMPLIGRAEPTKTTEGVTRPMQKILDALAELAALGIREASRIQVVFLSGYGHPNSKGFVNSLGALSTAGFVTYPRSGVVALTEAGCAAANHTGRPLTSTDLQRRVLDLLGAAHGRILQPLIEAYPAEISRQDLCAAAGYGHMNSKGFVNAIGRLRSLGFIDYPTKGNVVALPILFVGR